MADLRLKFSNLVLLVTDFLGLTSGSAPTGANLTKGTNLVNRGLRQFLYPIDKRTNQAYEWSFLKPLHIMNIVSGKWKYILPADFSDIITDPTYGDDDGYNHLRKISPEEILNLRAAGVINYAPYYYSIVPAKYNEEVGDRDEIWFHPEPDSSYSVKFYYKSDPLKLDDDNFYLPGGVKATEALIESCLAVAESQEDDNIGHHSQLAEKLIQDLIIVDSQKEDKTYLGNLYRTDEDYIIKRGERSRFDLDNAYPGE